MSATSTYLLWVVAEGCPEVPVRQLRERAGIRDVHVEVRTSRLSRTGAIQVPDGARDELGRRLPAIRMLGNELPPAGRVLVVGLPLPG